MSWNPVSDPGLRPAPTVNSRFPCAPPMSPSFVHLHVQSEDLSLSDSIVRMPDSPLARP